MIPESIGTSARSACFLNLFSVADFDEKYVFGKRKLKKFARTNFCEFRDFNIFKYFAGTYSREFRENAFFGKLCEH